MRFDDVADAIFLDVERQARAAWAERERMAAVVVASGADLADYEWRLWERPGREPFRELVRKDSPHIPPWERDDEQEQR